MKISKIVLLLKNNLIYYAVAITIGMLIINNLVYFVLVIPYGYYLYKVKNIHIKYIGIIVAVYIVSYTIQFSNELTIKESYEVTVLNNIEVDQYTSFIGEIGNNKVNVYLKDEVNLKPGDTLQVTGEIKIPDKATTPYGFNYRNYLKSKNIYQSIFTESYEITGHKWVLDSVPFAIENYIDDNIYYSKDYVKTFILADKNDFDQQTILEINNLGISHLFAVSGMHIGIIVLALKKLIAYLKIEDKKSDIMISLFLLFYIVITSFAPSVIRASLMFVFLVINKRLAFEFKTLDILSLIYILLLIYNPYYMYSLGFVLSFFVTFIILLSKNVLSNKSTNIQLLYLSSIAFFFTLPIVMNINHEVNLMTVLYNVGFIYIVTFILLPLSYLTFVFPMFDKLFSYIIDMFESIVSLLYKIGFMKISISFNNVFVILLYYILLVILMIKFEQRKTIKNQVIGLLLLLLFASNIAKVNLVTSVNFIDVYGDSTLIVDSFDQCNILIDTGEVDEYNTVVNFIKSKGIKRIDYLIISHMHSDHYGEANDVINNFEVVNFVSNNFNDGYIDRNINCGNLNLYIYPLGDPSKNENNNSLIISVDVKGEHYLFTGDIEKEAELDFIENYQFDIDVLKVAHHGSRTSSTEEFIKIFAPSDAFISAHRYNKFNHPNIETINTLEKYNVNTHQTFLEGTIEIKYIFKDRYIFSNPPTWYML